MNLWETDWASRCELDSSDSGYGREAGSCEHGNQFWGCIKGGEFLD